MKVYRIQEHKGHGGDLYDLRHFLQITEDYTNVLPHFHFMGVFFNKRTVDLIAQGCTLDECWAIAYREVTAPIEKQLINYAMAAGLHTLELDVF